MPLALHRLQDASGESTPGIPYHWDSLHVWASAESFSSICRAAALSGKELQDAAGPLPGVK